MNEIMNKINKTPIEIDLGVDGNGRTTARKLYEFLELNPSNYSKWAKTNITENQFAVENEDYEVFVPNDENPLGGRPTTDYHLTATFAKKLSMTAKNEKGEQARDYFIKVEDGAVKLTTGIRELSPQLQLLISMELKQKQLETDLIDTNNRIDNIKEVVALDSTAWRADTQNILNKIAIHLGGTSAFYQQLRTESYELLDRSLGVSLSRRLDNLKKNMALNGVSKSKINNANKMDVIALDKKLIEGYVAIVKKMAIKYGIADKKAV
jgi:anti-repressor protein